MNLSNSSCSHPHKHHKVYLFGLLGSFAAVKVIVVALGLISSLTFLSHHGHANFIDPVASCAGVTEIPETECQALLTLYNTTNGDAWTDNSNRGDILSICGSWTGVSCQNNQVISLDLHGDNLDGPIPSEISQIGGLQALLLYDNRITSLPASIGDLTELDGLAVNGNLLTSLPSEIGNLSNLTFLGVGGNRLTFLPYEIGNLSHLVILDIGGILTNLMADMGNNSDLGNNITTLPDELGNLTALQYLDLSLNQLSRLPDTIGNLSDLKFLLINDNALSTLPTSINGLINLQFLAAGGNKISSLPPEIGDLSSLVGLDLGSDFQRKFRGGNRLSSLPPEIGSLSNLQTLILSHNRLIEIPDEISNLSSLTTIALDNNFLTSVPESFMGLGNLTDAGGITIDGNCIDSGSMSSSLVDFITLKAGNSDWQTSAKESCPKTTAFCSTTTDILEPQCEALVALYNSTDGDKRKNNDGWFISPSVADRYGIMLDGTGNVIGIDLHSNNLAGTIPSTIADLTELKDLSVYDNSITSLDPAIVKLSQLETLLINNNMLTALPTKIGDLTNLKNLFAGGNSIAEIPDTINTLDRLEILDFGGILSNMMLHTSFVGGNELTSIPMISLAKLKSLDISQNRLTSLPNSIGDLPSLETLIVNNNYLSVLPDDIGNVSTLTNLSLGGNNLSSLPASFIELSALQRLDLGGTALNDTLGMDLSVGNNFSSFPDELKNLTNLTVLDISHNQLTTLPDVIGGLTHLTTFYLNNNLLTTLPENIFGLHDIGDNAGLFINNNCLDIGLMGSDILDFITLKANDSGWVDSNNGPLCGLGPKVGNATISGLPKVGATLHGEYNNGDRETLSTRGLPGKGGGSFVFDSKNIPYRISVNSKGENILVRLINGIWEQVGDMEISTESTIQLTTDTSGFPYVIYVNSNDNNKLVVMKFTGKSWETVGDPGVSLSKSNGIRIAFDTNDTPYIAYTDPMYEENITVMKFVDNHRETVGNPGFVPSSKTMVFYIGGDDLPHFAAITNSTTVSIGGLVDNVWTLTNTASFPYDNPSAPDYILTISRYTGVPYVAYKDPTNPMRIIVEAFNGSEREIVGSTIKLDGIIDRLVIDPSGAPYLISSEDIGDGMTSEIITKFNGTEWTLVRPMVTSAPENIITFDKNNNPYMSFYGPFLIRPTTSLEGTPHYQWYSDDKAIQGADALTYEITSDDIGKHIGFEVIPSDTSGHEEQSIKSTPVFIPDVSVDIPIISGDPYVGEKLEGNYNYGDNLTAWGSLGNDGFSADEVGNITPLVFDSGDIPYIAYIDVANEHKITVMKFNQEINDREIVGTDLPGNIGEVILALDNDDIPYVAYTDTDNNNKITVMKFNQDINDREMLGSPGFSSGSSGKPTLKFDESNTPYLLYANSENNNQLTIENFSDGDWRNLLSLDFGASDNSIAVKHGVVYLAYTDPNNGNISVVEGSASDGTIIQQIDTGLPGGVMATFSLAVDNNNIPYLTYNYARSKRTWNSRVLKLNTETLNRDIIGSFYQKSLGNIAFDAYNVPYLIYLDDFDETFPRRACCVYRSWEWESP
ncbi:MAG: leucine-rich repeat domain-containing protein [candidate division SR1 bacterium]|nr:leucine-rich repeat domain-containing protein [candidate division SR1 bacterium]